MANVIGVEGAKHLWVGEKYVSQALDAVASVALGRPVKLPTEWREEDDPVIRRLAFVAPWVALVALVLSWDRSLNGVTLGVDVALLAVTIVAAVYHAEIVAHRVGEPFGTLILAVAVTVIEVALIVAVMVSAGQEPSSLARDTVFSAVMITCNGIIGLALLTAAFRHHIPTFNAEGSGAALATVAALATLTLGGSCLHNHDVGADA